MRHQVSHLFLPSNQTKPRKWDWVGRSTSNRIHVFEDILPYVCTVEVCEISQALFSSIPDWARHQSLHAEQSDRALNCPFCGSSTASNAAFYEHVGRHLREIALAVLPQTNSSESEEGSESDAPPEYPPMARPNYTKRGSSPEDFHPTAVFKHRNQDPEVLKSYLKTLGFSDDQMTVNVCLLLLLVQDCLNKSDPQASGYERRPSWNTTTAKAPRG